MDPINPWVDAEEVRKLAQSLLMPIPRAPESPGEAYFGDGFVGFAGADLNTAMPVATAAPTADPMPATDPTPSPLPDVPDPAAIRRLHAQARESLATARERAEHGGLLQHQTAPEPPSTTIPPEPVPAAPAPPEADAPAAPPPAARPQPPANLQAPFVERLHAYGQWLRTAVEAKAFFVTDRDGHVLMDEVRAPKLLQVARTLAQASHAANRQAGGGAVGSLHVKLGESSILEVLPVDTSYGPLVLGIVVPSILGASAIPVIARGLEQVVAGPGR